MGKYVTNAQRKFLVNKMKTVLADRCKQFNDTQDRFDDRIQYQSHADVIEGIKSGEYIIDPQFYDPEFKNWTFQFHWLIHKSREQQARRNWSIFKKMQQVNDQFSQEIEQFKQNTLFSTADEALAIVEQFELRLNEALNVDVTSSSTQVNNEIVKVETSDTLTIITTYSTMPPSNQGDE